MERIFVMILLLLVAIPVVAVASEDRPIVEVWPSVSRNSEPLILDSPLVRIKDIARVQGVRDNQLYGLGLVIGLDGTGDSANARANVQMISNMLERFGITVSASDLRLRNIAAVMVTADVTGSVRNGDRIDVTVSSVGDSRSLQGGFLLQTPLEAANGEVYAAAQGPISIGGFNVRGGGGSAVTRNHPTVGMIPNGAIIEQEIRAEFSDGESLALVLREPDFNTAARLVSVLNQAYEPNTAWAQDQATIRVTIPPQYRGSVVSFVADLGELPIRPDVLARVIVNERTGTIVMGSAVRIATVAVAHGNLNVRVESETTVSQPPPLTEGETAVTTAFELEVEEERNKVMAVDGGSSVQDLVDALNAIGASPRDIIAILQAIKAAGALFGDLIIL